MSINKSKSELHGCELLSGQEGVVLKPESILQGHVELFGWIEVHFVTLKLH